MGVPIILYNNLLASAISYMVEGAQDVNYPFSNCYDWKAHTLFKYTGNGDAIELAFYNTVSANCIAIVHHNIFQCRGTSTPYILFICGAEQESKSITSDGMHFFLLSKTYTNFEYGISIWNLGSKMPYIGELWFGRYLEYPYPLSSPFVVNLQSKTNTAISDAGHFMNADFRYKMYTCKFEIEWIDESWYNSYHQPFLDYAIQGYPFIFMPDKSNQNEYYWARLKPNSIIPKARSYAGIIDKISLEFEMMKYEL